MGERRGDGADAGREARESAESDRFRALADHATELVAEFDAEGRYLYASPSYRALLGLEPAELLGTIPLDLIHPEDRKGSRKTFSAAVDGERESHSVHRLHHSDGSWRWFDNKGRAYRTVEGEIRFVSVGRDITERRAEDEALARRLAAEERLLELSRHLLSLGTRELTDSIVGALAVAGEIAGADRSHVIVVADSREGRFEIHGATEEGALPIRLERLPWLAGEVRAGRLVRFGDLGELPAAASDDREALGRRGVGALLGIPLRAGPKNLGMLVFEVVDAPRGWSDDEVTLLNVCADVFASSITRMRTEAELDDSRLQLIQAQKMDAVGRMAGGIAHDFNNLLMVIGGFSASLAAALGAEHPGSADAQEIAAAVARASKLTDQLLALSRRQVVETQLVDLNATIEGLREILTRLLGDELTLRVELGPDLPSVRVDSGQFEQALVNLAMNARNAMAGEGALEITTRVQHLDAAEAERAGLAEAGPHVVVTVRDSGDGMDEATQARVFEPFFTTREQGQGTGLGLSIVYGLVRQWGGAITLWSRPGQGTMLSIYLPAVEGSAEAAAPPVRQPAPKGSETVLVAEDEPPVRRLLCRVLARNGYRVIEASDGADALEKAGSHDGTIDLLLTDVVMPRMGGVALARRLRAERPGIPVLFFSGHPDERAEGSTDEVIAASFLQKPCAPTELLARVRETLDASGAGKGESPEA